MKYLAILLIFFASCSTPEYTIKPPETVEEPQPVIYEIVEKPNSDKVINEHSFTMLIDKIYTLIATTIAILAVDETNQ